MAARCRGAYPEPAMTETAAPDRGALAAKLPELTAADQHRLGRRLAGIRRIKDSANVATAALADLAGQVTRAEQELPGGGAAVGTITFPAELPVSRAGWTT